MSQANSIDPSQYGILKDNDPTMSLAQAIRERRSVRGFLDKTVPVDVLHNIFDLAQQSPSNCNILPWKVYVASGAKRDAISEQLVAAVNSGKISEPDFPHTPPFEGEYRKRQVDCAVALYDNMSIARDDKAGRHRAVLRNHELFDAPHVAFLCMDKCFDVSVATNVGMYAQSLMLAMAAHGVGSCPMGSLRYYPEIPSRILNIPENIGILFGLTFGYEDTDIPANKTRIFKGDINTSVVFSE